MSQYPGAPSFPAVPTFPASPTLPSVPTFPGPPTATITVAAATILATVPATAFGVNSAAWEGNLTDAAVPNLIKATPIKVWRYPGGSTADNYHYANNTVLQVANGVGSVQNTNFDAYMGVVNASGGVGHITVNYGSNGTFTAGGDPTEAANWVNYSNVTKLYGVKYWTIGNEVFGHSFGQTWETNLNTDTTPTGYSTNAKTFITGMKAKDSTIKIGVSVIAAGDYNGGNSGGWNQPVIAGCGTAIDFVDLHWYPGDDTTSDAALLGSVSRIPGIVTDLRGTINANAGSNAPNVGIWVGETNTNSTGKQRVGLPNALFLADSLLTWVEQGVLGVMWWDIFNGANTDGNGYPLGNNSAGLYGTATYGDLGLLSNGTSTAHVTVPAADTPYPPYYGYKLLSNMCAPGDTLVTVSSSQPLVHVHAAKQAVSGKLAVLIVNTDPTTTYPVTVNVSGYTGGSAVTTHTYGIGSTDVAASSLTGTGTVVTCTVAPYSLMALVW